MPCAASRSFGSECWRPLARDSARSLCPSPICRPMIRRRQCPSRRRCSWRRCGAGGGQNSRASPGATWRGWAELDETLADLSHAAEGALQRGEQFALRALHARATASRAARPATPQQLIIVAMGKLGGRELNFSSDIDLVPLYPESGETDGARPISNQEFFTRLAQQLSGCSSSRPRTASCFAWICGCGRSATAGRWSSNAAALEDYLQIARPRLGALCLGQGARRHATQRLPGAATQT